VAIQLVGETIDRRRAHLLAQEGRLVPLMRGVYASADQDVDAAVLAHAVRIAHYLYRTPICPRRALASWRRASTAACS